MHITGWSREWGQHTSHAPRPRAVVRETEQAIDRDPPCPGWRPPVSSWQPESSDNGHPEDMDERTVRHYTTAASERTAAYERAEVSAIHERMLHHFGEGTRLLEIGCGSGRDAAFLAAHGRNVTATDASEGMIQAARQGHPEMARQFHCLPFPFPAGSAMQGQTFDGVYAIAVIMHVPEEELFEFAFQIKSALRPGGTALLAFSTEREGLSDGRDSAGRLFIERPPGRIRLLFERLGFRVLEQRPAIDGMGRDIHWHTLVLRLADDAGNSPVDQIEGSQIDDL